MNLDGQTTFLPQKWVHIRTAPRKNDVETMISQRERFSQIVLSTIPNPHVEVKVVTSEIHLSPLWRAIYPYHVITDTKNTVAFDWHLQSYTHQEWVTFGNESLHMVLIKYPSLEVKVESVVPQVDIYQFVSFFGGGLGLFLGLAINNTLIWAYKFGRKHLEKRKAIDSKEMDEKGAPEHYEHDNQFNAT